jgi:hypothetical protein
MWYVLEVPAEIVARHAAGESIRSLARGMGTNHVRLSRALRRPEVAAQLAELRAPRRWASPASKCSLSLPSERLRASSPRQASRSTVRHRAIPGTSDGRMAEPGASLPVARSIGGSSTFGPLNSTHLAAAGVSRRGATPGSLSLRGPSGGRAPALAGHE